MTYVSVTERIGSMTAPRCTADVFEPDTLTVSSVDDGAVLRVFKPGEWVDAAVFDETDYPLFWFKSSTTCAPILSPAQLRAGV